MQNELHDQTTSDSSTGRTTHRRVGALDGLRGLAVLLVLGNHAAGSHFPGGGFGVDVFFVLSGFLITGLLLAELERSGRIYFAAFWARRALRLAPALVAVVLFVAVAPRLLALRFPSVEEFVTWKDVWGPLLYVYNWVSISNHDAPSLMPHAWSLAVEEQFYLVWPLVLLAFASAVRRLRVFLGIALGVAIAVMAVRAASGTSITALYLGTESRGAVMLLSGALVAASISARIPAIVGMIARWTWPAAALALAILVLTSAQSARWLAFGGWLLIAIVVAFLLLAALDDSTLWARALSCRPLVYVGRISYGLYLWQVPVIILVREVTGASSTTVAVIAVPITFAIAVASWSVLELPVQKWGRARLHHRDRQRTTHSVGGPAIS